jgi:phosphotransferase system  glucose/maltose/N-acetylglucosamine-specific IIC component
MISIGELLRHFAGRQKLFFVPLIVVLILASLLLLVSSGLGYVAPFVYALF